MNFKTFEHRIEQLHRRYGFHLGDCEVSANKIGARSFLILKNKEGKVIECMMLTDETKLLTRDYPEVAVDYD